MTLPILPTKPDLKKKKKTSKNSSGGYDFIVVSKDLSGFGWAKKLRDEHSSVVLAIRYDTEKLDAENLKKAKKVGQGILPVRDFDEVFKNRRAFEKAYWIFDQNHYWEEGEILIKEGFKVLGGSKLAYDMENDREFGVSLIKQAGILTPETNEFTTTEEGIAFLEDNEDRAFVFKPNTPNDKEWSTYVPDSEKPDRANEELRIYLECVTGDNADGFILQERIKGVEANFEIWMYKGEPYFAFCDLECKKRANGDLGGLVGGAQDIGFVIPLESRAVQETVWKLMQLKEFESYTGYLDMNVIVSDRQPYFLEFCARKGYPAHPTLYYALAISTYGDIIKDMLDGNIDDFDRHFKHGFAAGITLMGKDDVPGMPIYVAEDVEPFFFPYDIYKKDEYTLLAGSSAEVGIVTGHGYTLKLAAEDVLENMKRINFPNRNARTDLAENDYPSAPQGRYDALVAMKYL